MIFCEFPGLIIYICLSAYNFNYIFDCFDSFDVLNIHIMLYKTTVVTPLVLGRFLIFDYPHVYALYFINGITN